MLDIVVVLNVSPLYPQSLSPPRSHIEQPDGSWQKILQYWFIRSLSDRYLQPVLQQKQICAVDEKC